MIEFAILLHLRRTSDERVLNEFFALERPYLNMEVDGNTSEDLLKNNEKSTPLAKKSIRKERSTFLYQSHKIDYIALVVFGILFCAFNVVYWCYYLLL